MQEGIAAITATGMPESHGRVFQEVANRLQCVIASREVGKWATGLLLENYATKGFHNKAKSCPWGPMAGFVLADPRFTKNKGGSESLNKKIGLILPGGVTAGQRGDLLKAANEVKKDADEKAEANKSWGLPKFSSAADKKLQGDEIAKFFITETPLYITEERRQYLEKEGALKLLLRSPSEVRYAAEPPPDKDGPKTRPMKFVLRRTRDVPGADGKDLWAVLYGASEVRLSNDPKSPNTLDQNRLELLPVMAMVDVACPLDVRGTYRSATTGDYDLWAVFPHRDVDPKTGWDKTRKRKTENDREEPGGFDRKFLDKRMVPGSNRFSTPLHQYVAHEDKHKGNLTPRIEFVRHAINTGVRAAGYTGGDVVHHSDEAGRPMVSSIDFPFVAFVPGKTAYRIMDVSDLKEFIRLLNHKYVISLNPGWQRQLGIDVSAGGSYTV